MLQRTADSLELAWRHELGADEYLVREFIGGDPFVRDGRVGAERLGDGIVAHQEETQFMVLVRPHQNDVFAQIPQLEQRIVEISERPAPEEFSNYMKAELERWAKVIKVANVRVD